MSLHVGDKALSRESGLVHIVGYAASISWDSLCETIYDNYQPDHYVAIQGDGDIIDPPGTEAMPRETVVTCVLCLAKLWDIARIVAGHLPWRE